MKHFFLITVAALGALLATAPAALADMNCTGTITGLITINGNLNVPDNATCILIGGGTVTGNVTVGQNAALNIQATASNPWIIGGNLQANNCAYVAMNPFGNYSTIVVGNVQVGNCTGSKVAVGLLPAGTAFGTLGPASVVGGDVQCHNNTGTCIVHTDNIRAISRS